VLDRIGVGLWTMRSMAFSPRNRVRDYRAFREDAILAEQLGFHSIWSAEHRIWYDGWCPAPLHAQAAAAAVTERLRFGNAVALASMHDPYVMARAVGDLDRLSDGRVDLGVGLGHRDAEFDALGLRRDRRGKRMEEALDVYASVWRGEHGDPLPVQQPGPPVWIGGMAPKALERACSRGHNLILPQTLFPHEVRRLVDDIRSRTPTAATIGTLRDLWIEPDPKAAKAFRERYIRHFREEAGSWWVLKGQPAFSNPDELERQMSRITDAALIGSSGEVAAGLRALLEAGADFLTLRINFDMVSQAALREQLHRIAEALPPLLSDVVAPLEVIG
jgi:alkanesulfonate monooxygenase SsuD/methylene tetrahydromethanopterin reductase-like flavin-dependent oxidoreductase (luciferase family)